MANVSKYARTMLGQSAVEAPGVLLDDRRTRTAWFDGQHVMAEDFNRDQSYHLTRHADLGRVIGKGVAFGLEVSRAEGGSETRISVSEGLGLAGSGEVIDVPFDLDLNLADIASQRALDKTMRMEELLAPPPETRTGLFVLCASLVEFTSNPVASYPIAATGRRKTQDSVISEAVLFTLAGEPMPTRSGNDMEWRSEAARRIFLDRKALDIPAAALPLALVALEGNQLRWIDGPMVRRELLAGNVGLTGLPSETAARRRAHVVQFDALLAEERDSTPPPGFAATRIASCLPAVGRLPRDAVAMRSEPGGPMRLSQSWLPADVPVELIALPEDEIDALVEDHALLPPIDLSASPEVLANTPVSIVVPVPRANWMDTPASVVETSFSLTPPPAVGGRDTKPRDLVQELLNGRVASPPAAEIAPEAWTDILSATDTLWYMRRTQHQRADVAMDGLRPVAGTEEGEDLPLPPQPEPADLSRFIEPVREDLVALLRSQRADHLAEGLFVEDQEPQLLYLNHLQLIRSRQSLTGVFALAEGVLNGRFEPMRAVEAFPVQSFDTLRDIEHGLMGTGALVLPVAENSAQREARLDILSEFLGGGRNRLERISADRVPFHLPPVLFEEQDRFSGLLFMLSDVGFAIRFAEPGFDSDVMHERRLRLVDTGAIPDLGAQLSRLEERDLARRLGEARALFLEGSLSGRALGEEILQLMGA